MDSDITLVVSVHSAVRIFCQSHYIRCDCFHAISTRVLGHTSRISFLIRAPYFFALLSEVVVWSYPSFSSRSHLFSGAPFSHLPTSSQDPALSIFPSLLLYEPSLFADLYYFSGKAWSETLGTVSSVVKKSCIRPYGVSRFAL